MSASRSKTSSYLPAIEMLHRYFEISGDDDPRLRREKVTSKVLLLDRGLEDSLPMLLALLGIEETPGALARMDARIRRHRTLDAVKHLLLRESVNQPLVVIFEDLHWIDNESQALLDMLAEGIANARVLMVVTYRPEYRHQWSTRMSYTQVRLDPLETTSAQEMLAQLVGADDSTRLLMDFIIERTEGNPFFIEETVQVLFDDGTLVRNGGIKLTKPLDELRIPPTVHALLSSRIDRLPAAEKQRANRRRERQSWMAGALCLWRMPLGLSVEPEEKSSKPGSDGVTRAARASTCAGEMRLPCARNADQLSIALQRC